MREEHIIRLAWLFQYIYTGWLTWKQAFVYITISQAVQQNTSWIVFVSGTSASTTKYIKLPSQRGTVDAKSNVIVVPSKYVFIVPRFSRLFFLLKVLIYP